MRRRGSSPTEPQRQSRRKKLMTTDKTKIGAISVIGGGIAGMQAALDAANAGFKVYLVEKDISIGGVMAQLDKTFPTNDCSTCLISPKLIEVARHPDIEIITQSEIAGVEGEAGTFQVDCPKRAPNVDEAKCTGCGVCTAKCPIRYEVHLPEKEKPAASLCPGGGMICGQVSWTATGRSRAIFYPFCWTSTGALTGCPGAPWSSSAMN